MEAIQFEPVLQTIATGLVEKIISNTGMEEEVAMEKLYLSSLYKLLEKEETKVWHYSVTQLYELWDNEMKTGQVVLPE